MHEQTQNTSSRMRNGQSKVDRYNWTTDRREGQFRRIPKSELLLTAGYQRSQSDQEGKIIRIARNFPWPAFGVISVAERPNGELYVFDGAGRVSGANRRDDIDLIPCMVFPFDSLPDEAQAFLMANANRKPVSAVAKHNAGEIAGLDAAVLVEELAEQANRTISAAAGPGTISCVARVTRLVVQDESRMRRLWPLIVETCHGRPMHERIVDGFFHIDRYMDKSLGESLTSDRWAQRIKMIGYDALLTGAAKASAYHAKGGAAVWAEGMVRALNTGLRADRRIILETAASRKNERDERIRLFRHGAVDE